MPQIDPWLLASAGAATGGCLGFWSARLSVAMARVLDVDAGRLSSWEQLVASGRRSLRPKASASPILSAAHVVLVALAGGAGGVLGSGEPALTAVLVVGAWLVVFAALLDLRSFWLPDVLTVPLFWMGVLAAAAGIVPVGASEAVLGAAVCGGLFLVTASIGRLVCGRLAIAGGDVKLAVALGGFCGLEALADLMQAFGFAAIGLALAWRLVRLKWPGIKPPADVGEGYMPLGPAIAVAGAWATALNYMAP